MPLIKEEEIRNNAIKNVAEKMLIAARTAPKARGIDNLVLGMIEGKDIELVSSKMKEIAITSNQHFFERDANNILNSPIVILLGTRIAATNLNNCSLCGFKNCDEKNLHPENPCAYNTTDLGIAIGSAVSIAADHRVDCRVMFSVGQAAKELNYFEKDVKVVFGVPLSVSNKNPFFDRK